MSQNKTTLSRQWGAVVATVLKPGPGAHQSGGPSRSPFTSCEVDLPYVSDQLMRITLHGQLVAGKPAGSTREMLFALHKLVRVDAINLDLGGVTSIDRDSLSVLDDTCRRARARGTRCDLINIPQHIAAFIKTDDSATARSVRLFLRLSGSYEGDI